MDQQELQKNIALYYSKLSPELQETFSSMNWLETLKQIATKYSLNEGQIQTLGTETTLVLLGMIHPEEYYKIIEKNLGPLEDILEKIITEINNSVINPIRPELTEVFEKNTKSQTPEGQKIEDELDERFAKLPLEIQNTIRESNYHETLYEIGTKYNLIISQIADLEIVTTNVMLGIIKGNEFENSVKNSLKLPDSKIKELVNDITEKILKKIREKMKEVFDMKTETSTKEETDVKKMLGEHGIEILNGNTSTPPKKDTPQEGNNTLPVPEKLELPKGEEVHPVLAQKFINPVQSGVVKTEHGLDNITKTTEKLSTVAKVDPYREIPE